MDFLFCNSLKRILALCVSIESSDYKDSSSLLRLVKVDHAINTLYISVILFRVASISICSVSSRVCLAHSIPNLDEFK
jgi:hypothetical protein